MKLSFPYFWVCIRLCIHPFYCTMLTLYQCLCCHTHLTSLRKTSIHGTVTRWLSFCVKLVHFEVTLFIISVLYEVILSIHFHVFGTKSQMFACLSVCASVISVIYLCCCYAHLRQICIHGEVNKVTIICVKSVRFEVTFLIFIILYCIMWYLWFHPFSGFVVPSYLCFCNICNLLV